jgi:hypothetical protein
LVKSAGSEQLGFYLSNDINEKEYSFALEIKKVKKQV